MSTFTYTLDNDQDIQINANIAKDILIDALEKEGLLRGDASEIKQSYSIILHKKNILGGAIDRLLKKLGYNIDNSHFIVQKMILPDKDTSLADEVPPKEESDKQE